MSGRGESAEDLERLRAVQRAVQRLATTRDPPEDLPDALARWGVDAADAAVLSSYPIERVSVYGGLVGGTILTAIRNQLFTTARRLPEETLEALVRQFLEEEPPRSPYLRDVPFEFAMWALREARDVRQSLPRDVRQSLPRDFADLVRYELLLFAVGTAERGPRPSEAEPLSADRGVWLEGTVHLARFQYAVHRLSEEARSTDAPAEEQTALLVYRDAKNEAQTLELSPLSMEMLERLAAGTLLGAAIEGAGRAVERPIDVALIEELSRVLADLAYRGALLGPAPATATLPRRAELSPYWDWLVRGNS